MKPLNWKIADGQGLVHLVACLTHDEAEFYRPLDTHRVCHTAKRERYVVHVSGCQEVLMCCGVWLNLQPRTIETKRATCLVCLGT